LRLKLLRWEQLGHRHLKVPSGVTLDTEIISILKRSKNRLGTAAWGYTRFVQSRRQWRAAGSHYSHSRFASWAAPWGRLCTPLTGRCARQPSSRYPSWRSDTPTDQDGQPLPPGLRKRRMEWKRSEGLGLAEQGIKLRAVQRRKRSSHVGLRLRPRLARGLGAHCCRCYGHFAT
jgi:hypothetical protein